MIRARDILKTAAIPEYRKIVLYNPRMKKIGRAINIDITAPKKTSPDNMTNSPDRK
jgi:hypothetical protein|tara:strand:+ start:480 stop:647 length:168 start_codon:yes stop_codon:yes gene_type:complete